MTRRATWITRAVEFFDAKAQRVYTRKELAALLAGNSEELGTPATLNTQRFIDTLEEIGPLRMVPVNSVLAEPSGLAPTRSAEGEDHSEPGPYRGFTRYVWRDASAYEIALSLRAGSYLSHASAVFLNALTTAIPRTIYVNKEQSAKPETSGSLTQEAIDRAFKNRPRISRYVFAYAQSRIILLSGKQTGNLEVSEVTDASGRALPTTKLERTLIDITVRPNYAGGVFEVLEAFRGAVGRISIPTLTATLKKLGYVYPYNQAIGFYMQRSGFSSSQLQRLKALGIQHNFYLANQIPGAQLDPVWRVYYPEGL